MKLLGTPHYIDTDIPFTMDSGVQLVCKYLHAYKSSLAGNSKGIDKLYRDGQLISLEPNLSEMECHALLQEFMPKHIIPTKITQQLFIR